MCDAAVATNPPRTVGRDFYAPSLVRLLVRFMRLWLNRDLLANLLEP